MPGNTALEVENPEAAVEIYSKILGSKQGTKKARRGGCDLRRLDEEGSSYELVTSYVYKPGRFSKERSVVAILPLKRAANGVYKGYLGETVFRVLVDRKGSLEEEWSGNLDEARERIPEIVEMYLEDVGELAKALRKAH